MTCTSVIVIPPTCTSTIYSSSNYYNTELERRDEMISTYVIVIPPTSSIYPSSYYYKVGITKPQQAVLYDGVPLCGFTSFDFHQVPMDYTTVRIVGVW